MVLLLKKVQNIQKYNIIAKRGTQEIHTILYLEKQNAILLNCGLHICLGKAWPTLPYRDTTVTID